MSHQDLSATAEFQHNSKPIGPNKAMTVKEKGKQKSDIT